MPHPAILFSLAILLAVAPLRAAESDGNVPMPSKDLPILAGELSGPVFPLTAAARDGRIFSLNPSTFEVHVFDSKGRAKDPVELYFLKPPRAVFNFDVNATGRIWALSNPRDIYFFRDDGHLIHKQDLTDPPAQIMEIALTKMGSSVYVNRQFYDFLEYEDGPTLIGRLDQRGRETDIAFELPPDANVSDSSFRRLLLLDVAEDGRLWAAERGRYDFWEISSAGRKLSHLTDETIEVDFSKSPVAEEMDLPFDVADPDGSDHQPVKSTLKGVVRDFDTHGGLLWVLVRRPGEAQQLDVIDPTTGVVKTIELPSSPTVYRSVAVTDRYVVLPTSDEEFKVVLDRSELLYRLSERESASELKLETADAEDPTAEVPEPMSSEHGSPSAVTSEQRRPAPVGETQGSRSSDPVEGESH